MAIRKKDEPVVKKFEQRFGSGADRGPVLHIANGHGGSAPLTERKAVKISTVSHTLDADVAEQLRHFAFRERISESAVIEFALRELFGDGDERELGQRLRAAGAALRRRS